MFITMNDGINRTSRDMIGLKFKEVLEVLEIYQKLKFRMFCKYTYFFYPIIVYI